MTQFTKSNLLALLLVLCVFAVCAQEDRFWYFGENGVGIDWGSCEPEIVQGSQLGFEGTASISDENGVLQFYTNGDFIWDRNHNLMLGGDVSDAFYDPTFPIGELSTLTQIGLAKNPLSNSYYMFTSEIQGTGAYDFRYVTIDMDLNAGLGQVVGITTLVDSPMTEKICSVPKADGSGFWIITHEYLNNRFLVFSVDGTGVNPTPQSFDLGSVHGPTNNNINSRGELKANLSGTKLCVVQNSNNGAVELFDFNSNTGEISNPLLIANLGYPFGISFSPNEALIYIGTWSVEQNVPNRLFQFDISSNNPMIIGASETILFTAQVPLSFGSIKMAPNGKLYVAKDGTSLGVINNPDLVGTACNYNHNGFDLQGANTLFGLNTIWEIPPGQSTAAQLDLPNSISACEPLFIGPDEVEGYTYLWNTNETTASIYAENSGTYTLEVDANGCLLSASIELEIAPLVLDLGEDIEACEGSSVILNPEINNATALWSTGETTSEIEITSAGSYTLELTQGSCNATDDINISFIPSPSLSISGDSLYCPGETAFLLAESNGEITWMDGSTNNFFETNISSTVTATATNGNCSTAASFELVYLPIAEKLESIISEDLCKDEEIRILLGEGWTSWQVDGNPINDNELVLSAGEYELVRTNACESFTSLISLVEEDCSCPIYVPNTFTPDNDGKNDVFAPSNECGLEIVLYIFNRWGELIHQSRGSDAAWIGNVNGGEHYAPDGLYIYQIKQFDLGESITTGFVALIR